VFSLIPHIAFAAGEGVNTLVRALNQYIFNPIIILLFLLALIYFIYGLIKFIQESGSSEGRSTGGRHIMYGLIGMLIMISVYWILGVLMDTFGVDNINLDPDSGQDFVEIDLTNRG
jgi:hypothetical protein